MVQKIALIAETPIRAIVDMCCIKAGKTAVIRAVDIEAIFLFLL